MKWIKLYEEFQLGDLNFMSPVEIQELFMQECKKQTPDINLIRVIVENGLVSVNAKGNYGWSPLLAAVYNDNVAIAELLISAGANVNAEENDGGYSPLVVAVREDNLEIAKLLISAGANVDIQDYEGRSPLYWAFWWNNKEMQALLKKHGAL